MTDLTVGIDVGSTYTKAALLGGDGTLLATAMSATGFRLDAAAEQVYGTCSGMQDFHRRRRLRREHRRRTLPGAPSATSTDLTAQGRGTGISSRSRAPCWTSAATTMKASRLDDRARGRVPAERQVRRGHRRVPRKDGTLPRIRHRADRGGGRRLRRRRQHLGVCAVFAESEVINHVSSGRAPGEILHGVVVSLVARSVQLMKRARLEPEITLVGGIMRFPTMVRVLREELGQEVNVPPEPLAQFTAAIGAAVLGQQRLAKRAAAEHAAA